MVFDGPSTGTRQQAVPHVQRNGASSVIPLKITAQRKHTTKKAPSLRLPPLLSITRFLIGRRRRDGGGTEGGEHGGPTEIFCDGPMTLSSGEEKTRSDHHDLPSFSGRDGLIGGSLARRLFRRRFVKTLKALESS